MTFGKQDSKEYDPKKQQIQSQASNKGSSRGQRQSARAGGLLDESSMKEQFDSNMHDVAIRQRQIQQEIMQNR